VRCRVRRCAPIDADGSPSDAVVAQLQAKVGLLGGTITSHRRVAGVDAETFMADDRG
jgi:hypothetical protein